MAYFAQLDENDIVVQVIAINNLTIGEPELSFPETEPLGQSFINDIMKLDGIWKQTSYNGSFRGRYAGIGFTYDDELDEFVEPKTILELQSPNDKLE